MVVVFTVLLFLLLTRVSRKSKAVPFCMAIVFTLAPKVKRVRRKDSWTLLVVDDVAVLTILREESFRKVIAREVEVNICKCKLEHFIKGSKSLICKYFFVRDY